MELRWISVSVLITILLSMQCELCYGDKNEKYIALLIIPCCCFCCCIYFVCSCCCYMINKKKGTETAVTVPSPIAFANPSATARTTNNSAPLKAESPPPRPFPRVIDTHKTNLAPPSSDFNPQQINPIQYPYEQPKITLCSHYGALNKQSTPRMPMQKYPIHDTTTLGASYNHFIPPLSGNTTNSKGPIGKSGKSSEFNPQQKNPKQKIYTGSQKSMAMGLPYGMPSQLSTQKMSMQGAPYNHFIPPLSGNTTNSKGPFGKSGKSNEFNPQFKPQQINPKQKIYQGSQKGMTMGSPYGMPSQPSTPKMSMQGAPYNQFIPPLSDNTANSKGPFGKEKTKAEMISHITLSAKSNELNLQFKPQHINPKQKVYQGSQKSMAMGSPYGMPSQLSTPKMSMQGTPYNQFTKPSSSVSTIKGTTGKEKSEAEMIKHMVSSAKNGQWENVWEVLDHKPHLVNCIPSDRAWSVLHQAVWHNNVQAVLKILSYPACDTEIRTKQDKANKSGPGKKPIDIAQSQQVKEILQSHQGRQVMSSEAPTMVTVYEMLNSLGGCIHMTLSCKQGVLIPNKWPIEEYNTIQSIPYIMRTIFWYINKADNWVNARNKVSLTLQQYSKAVGNKLWKKSEMINDNKHQFFSRIIQLYTEDLSNICSAVNKMLRLQNNSICEYQPTSLELSLCPYALLLNSILLHWNELEGNTGITYRSCSLTREQADKYVKGHRFVWLSFTSSTKQQGAFIAVNYSYETSVYEFIIYNSMYNQKWAPRRIAKYSAFALEEECLYPFGAKFEVTGIFGNKIHICLIDY